MRKAKIGVGQELEESPNGFFIIQRENGVEMQDWAGEKLVPIANSYTDEQLWNACQCIFEFETDKKLSELEISDIENAGVDGYISIMESMTGGDVAIRPYHIELMRHYKEMIKSEWDINAVFPNDFKNWNDWNYRLWDFAQDDAQEIEQIFREDFSLPEDKDTRGAVESAETWKKKDIQPHKTIDDTKGVTN